MREDEDWRHRYDRIRGVPVGSPGEAMKAVAAARHLTEADLVAEVRAKHASGRSMRSIGADYGISQYPIFRMVHGHGAPSVTQRLRAVEPEPERYTEKQAERVYPRRSYVKPKMSLARAAEAINRHAHGDIRWDVVAEEFGVSPRTLMRWVRRVYAERRGVDTRAE